MPETSEEMMEEKIMRALIGSAKSVVSLVGITQGTPEEVDNALKNLEEARQIEFVAGEGWKLVPPQKML